MLIDQLLLINGLAINLRLGKNANACLLELVSHQILDSLGVGMRFHKDKGCVLQRVARV